MLMRQNYVKARAKICLERVSIECRKTKTKVITLANQKDGDNPVSQSKLEVITRSRHKARENVHARATVGFGFTSDWLTKWSENFEPITERSRASFKIEFLKTKTNQKGRRQSSKPIETQSNYM